MTALFALSVGGLALASAPPAPSAARVANPLHPVVPLLDAQGRPVLESGGPISTRTSCGGCHDAAWIEAHSYHAQLGADRPYAEGAAPRPWDRFEGPFGRWSPLTYRYLSGPDEARPDADLEAWARILGPRHVGGGPFAELGEEMDCLMCHSEDANEPARRRALASGALAWQATATLEGGPVVTATTGGWRYRAEAFDAEHRVSAADLGLVTARPSACGSCHGAAPEPGFDPVTFAVEDFSRPDPRAPTGLVFSAQPMHRSAVNLAGKQALTRSWDVHAERLVTCGGCHGTLNDPAGGAKAPSDTPAHLRFDARGEALKDYLQRPQHDFATGYAAPGVLGRAHAGSMRRCEDCHDASATHEWLPYADRHFSALLCESCHVPKVHAPLLESVDWTVLTAQREPKLSYRGVRGDPNDPRALVEGVTPVLLARDAPGARLGPHNLVTAFYWVEGDPPRPVRRADLERALFDGDAFAADVLAALDDDHDGALGPEELHLGDEARVAAIRRRLEAVGVPAPRILGEIQPYGLHHQVAGRGFALKTCDSCHGDGGRVGAPMRLTPRAPAGVDPTFVKDARVHASGVVLAGPDGSLSYAPNPSRDGVYVLGAGAPAWVGLVGWAALALVLIGSAVHGGLRLAFGRVARGSRR